MESVPNLIELIKEKVIFGQNLLESLTKFKEVDGIQKLGRKINQELSFLNKVNHSIKRRLIASLCASELLLFTGVEE